MKNILLVLAFGLVLTANAQDYEIFFAGTGLSTVNVENLTKGLSVIVNAGEILNLSSTTDIPHVENKEATGMKIYPNPVTDKTLLEISPLVAGDVTITVYELSGKIVSSIEAYLENSLQKFSISGIKKGLYLINVKAKDYQITGKLLSLGNSNEKPVIEKISSNLMAADLKTEKKDSKGTRANVDFQYTTGDILKYTATSGLNRTVIIDIPTSNKTVTFTFVACTDGSANNYPVVTIGTQTWMAGNLKTTKFASGANITQVTTAGGWYDIVLANIKAYCWYDDNIVNKDTYGALYSWAAAMNGAASSSANPSGIQGVCPTGWHLPSDAEWTTLVNYLGGETLAGGKLKETGISRWSTPNTGADNSSGFTALPGGNRTMYGAFEYLGTRGGWWSSTEYATNYGYRRCVEYNITDVTRTSNHKSYAYSVRCIKNN